MSIVVEPGNVNNTHHLSLSDGKKTVGLIACDSQGTANIAAITRNPENRTAMKTTSGNAKYSDFESPWTPIAQEDWSGGRGNDDYDEDTTRYNDGNRANTLFGPIMHGPQEQYCTGLRSANTSFPGSVSWCSLLSSKFFANKFIPTADYTASQIWMLVRRVGTPTAALSIALYDNNAGVPGSAVKTMTVTTTSITDTLSEWWLFDISGGSTVTGSTIYWIVATSTAGDDANHWEIGCNSTHTYGKESADGTTWTNSMADVYYRVVDAPANNYTRFFQYKRAMYLVRSTASAASKLYINGDRGAADANTGALTTLVDATKTWIIDEWAGCYVIIVAGVGSNEIQTWRKILSNTETTLTVDAAWEITHDTTTDYVIVGSNKWTEITGHGLTARVTDVLVINNTIYFAQGDAVAIRRATFFNNGGTWTLSYADDGTNKAIYLCTVRNPTSGLIQVWKANNLDATSKKSVDVADVVAWGSNMTFSGVPITFEDNFGNITGLEEYGEEDKYLWVFREGTIYAINAGKPDEIPLREIRTMMSESNGKAHTIHDAYLYINLGGGLQQFYNRQLTDVGTNRDEGLPADKRGPVVDLQGYPGMLFEAVDAGITGYSAIYGWNTTGWCEMYRAPLGQRIDCIDYQVIPDVGLDRMWVSQGNDVIWLPFPSNTLDPSKDAVYPFTHEASVVSGWLYAGLPDVVKLYNSMKIFSEQLDPGSIWCEMDYQKDSDTTWTPLSGIFEESPVQEVDLSIDDSVQGKRLRYRIRSYTNNCLITPLIKSVVIDTISRIPTRYSLAMSYRLEEGGTTLRGAIDDQGTPDDVQAILDEWSNELTRLKVHCTKKIFDDMRVFINPSPLSVVGDKLEKYTGRLTMIEV
jgi:hypothetical protein